MTIDEKHVRDWYYRNAMTAFREYLKANRRTKDFAVYSDALLSACEKNAEIAAEFVEQGCDRLRYVNHRTDKRGKLIGLDVVFCDSEEWKTARERYWERRRG